MNHVWVVESERKDKPGEWFLFACFSTRKKAEETAGWAREEEPFEFPRRYRVVKFVRGSSRKA